jgi:hypothetical protein
VATPDAAPSNFQHRTRAASATHLLESGYDIRMVRELLGHKDVKVTMIYRHVLNKGGHGVRSPVPGARVLYRPDPSWVTGLYRLSIYGWRGRFAPRQRSRVFPSAVCPGAPRRANQRLQRMAGPASRLACPSPAEPRLRSLAR